MNTIFSGIFLDGKTAAKQPATLAAKGSGMVLQWMHGQRSLMAGDVMAIHPRQKGVQFLRLTDGSTCEMPASLELLAMLGQAGVGVQKPSAVAAILHGDWRIAAMAIAFLVGVVTAFYVWLLPSFAQYAATMVPVELQRKLGETALHQIEAQWLSPSQLPSAQRGQIQRRFETLTKDLNGPEYARLELLIRKSGVGPNAFALPGNFIVLTDDLVTLVDGDLDAISGVLAHELGHLKHRHSLRSVVQGVAMTVLASALIGDYSSALAAVPAGLGHLNYSRHFESEADGFSYALLCQEKINPAATALFFDRVSKIDTADKLIPAYLSSHPVSQDRARYFREACPKP